MDMSLPIVTIANEPRDDVFESGPSISQPVVTSAREIGASGFNESGSSISQQISSTTNEARDNNESGSSISQQISSTTNVGGDDSESGSSISPPEPSSQPQKPKRRAYLKDPNIRKAIETEHLTGVRYCSKCDKFLPLDQFKPITAKCKRQYMCIPHIREKARIEAMGTQPKRAYNILRSMARPDMIEFGHTKMNIGRPAVIGMLSEEHIANPGEYCLMPKRPDLPLSMPNSIILTRPQRLYLINRWRKTRDAQQYMRDLWHLLEPASSAATGTASEAWARLFNFE